MTALPDRLRFSSRRLANGMTLHHHAMDVPYFSLTIMPAAGTAHGHGSRKAGIPGIAHFFEHALFHRSERFPEKDSFAKQIQLKGGYWNATTFARHTSFYIHAPTAIAEEAIEGLFDHVFRPRILEEDLAIERTIVANERNQRRYYPAATELGQYLNTKWMQCRTYPLEQLFGTNEDLARMTPETLSPFLDLYRTPATQIILGGSVDPEFVRQIAESIVTSDSSVPELVEAPGWSSREYHERAFEELSAPEYYLGGSFGAVPIEDEVAVAFALRLLTNDIHGPLYEWTRTERGWTYGIDYSWSTSCDRAQWRIELPLNDPTMVPIIRAEIHDRMRAALADATLVERERVRRELVEVFLYQTLDDRVDTAISNLQHHGRMYEETDFRRLRTEAAHPDRLLEIFDTYLSPAVTGEFLAVPKG